MIISALLGIAWRYFYALFQPVGNINHIASGIPDSPSLPLPAPRASATL